jgi:hypothetical protein
MIGWHASIFNPFYLHFAAVEEVGL